MSSIAEIEAAVSRLTPEEFARFSEWFAQQREIQWDREIERDSARGSLDFLLQEVDHDIAAGKTRSTDELCDNA